MVKGRAMSVIVFGVAALVLWLMFSGGLSRGAEPDVDPPPPTATRAAPDTESRTGTHRSPRATSNSPRSLWSVVDDAQRRRVTSERNGTAPGSSPARRSVFEPHGTRGGTAPTPARTAASAPRAASDTVDAQTHAGQRNSIPGTANVSRVSTRVQVPGAPMNQPALAAEGTTRPGETHAIVSAERGATAAFATATTTLSVLAAIVGLALILVLGAALLRRR